MSNENETSTEATETTESLITSPNQTTDPPSSTDEDKSLITDPDGEKTVGKEGATEYTPLKAEDLTIPEGMEVDQEGMDGFLNLVNEHQLPREAVDQLVALQADVMGRAADALSEAYDTMLSQWREEAKSHPDFGGDKLNPTLGKINAMIREEAGEQAQEIFQALDLTGAGNHPAIIGFLSKLAAKYAEGTPTVGQPGMLNEASLAERMFPNQGKG